jgi:hypothetical protein
MRKKEPKIGREVVKEDRTSRWLTKFLTQRIPWDRNIVSKKIDHSSAFERLKECEEE